MILSAITSALRRDEKGAALIEFAIVAPVFLTLLLGAFEFGHMVYVKAVLQGSIHDAGRDAGLESGAHNLSLVDSYVLNQVRIVAPQGAVVTSRKNYQNFYEVGKPEDFNDANGNELYDDDECFTDANGNGAWDSDRSMGGLGGADDVVVYTATVTYNRIVPLWKMLGWDERNSVSATTILRNQPFGDQSVRQEVQICPV
ncbi:MAG: pilus assembly protein [Sphingomonadaceae bacterium]|nr:pilus assembly protein [Sphingomonadaceae bacterium]